MTNDESTPETVWAYRVAPIREEWLTGVQARAALDMWMNRPEETGAPSITVSRRPVESPAERRLTPMTEYLNSPCVTCRHILRRHDDRDGCLLPHCACGTYVYAG